MSSSLIAAPGALSFEAQQHVCLAEPLARAATGGAYVYIAWPVRAARQALLLCVADMLAVAADAAALQHALMLHMQLAML